MDSKTTKNTKKHERAEVKKEVKKDVKKAERKAEQHKPANSKSTQKPAPPKGPSGPATNKEACVHAGALAAAHQYCDKSSAAVPPPELLGFGSEAVAPRLYEWIGEGTMVANDFGFACATFEASGWIPSFRDAVSQPEVSFIGGVNGATVQRGPLVVLSQDDYVGLAPGLISPGEAQVPQTGATTTTFGGSDATGVNTYALPEQFFPGQLPIDQSSQDSSEARQTFQIVSITAECAPDGYALGSAEAVNVVSGELMSVSVKSGDNRMFTPSSTLFTTATGNNARSFSSMYGLPENLRNLETQSVDEWPKGKVMSAFALPNTSTALVPWLPAVPDPANLGTNVVCNKVDSPQVTFIADGCQKGQQFRVTWRYVIAAFGVESYEANATTLRTRKPTDPQMLNDLMFRTLPLHAKPALVPTGKANPSALKAYGHSLKDMGYSKPEVMKQVPATAKTADSSFGSNLGDILLDVGIGLLGALF
jgi:hypothetical protein